MDARLLPAQRRGIVGRFGFGGKGFFGTKQLEPLIMRLQDTLTTLPFLVLNAFASGSVSAGGNCSLSNNRLDPSTHKFLTDCDDKSFCAPDEVCTPKGCRRDMFPFGYAQGEQPPPLCSTGLFCADEEDHCRPLLPVGALCQMNRDGLSLV